MAPDATTKKSIILPVPITVQLVNPHEIYSCHVESRRVVYLDTNIWIRLTDARTQLSRECFTLCREAVRSGAVIFPLSYASISELLHQPPDAPREIQANLMDELSLGITFRSTAIIEKEESHSAFSFFASEDYQPVPHSALFTYVVDYIGDGVITFPEGWTVAHIRAFVEQWRSAPHIRSVSWFITHSNINEIKENHEKSAKIYVNRLRETINQSSEHFRNSGQFSRDRLRHEERMSLFNSIVLPSFRKIIIEHYDSDEVMGKIKTIFENFPKHHGRGGPKFIEKLFSLMPSIELFAQLMASRVMNPTRAVRPEDFWDIEHARVPAAYADAFVTEDGGLVDLLSSRSSIPKTQGCRIIQGLKSFADLLREYIQAADSSS
jgi:hypothetical protein